MTSANRVQLAWVTESTPGTTPNTPRMRKMRFTGENLSLNVPEYQDGDEITDDRMTDDPVKIFSGASGSINFNLHYPVNNSPESDIIASGMDSTWTVSAERDNDGTADSVITDLGTSAHVAVCTTGTSFVAGQLVQFSGNTDSANNLIARCTTGSATVPAFSAVTFTVDTTPAAASRMKVVGFQGAAADITATAAGLASTLLNFTTLGLVVGQSLKIGGTAAGDQFATAALNAWVTINTIAANLITLDNKPSGWTTDAGAGKTIKVWFGDFIKNGTLTNATRVSGTIEKGFLGQATPYYHRGRGMSVDSLVFNFKHKDKIRVVANFKSGGDAGDATSTPLDASPDARTTNANFSANVNFAKLMEGGVALATPNFCRSLDLTLSNNYREIEDITQATAAGLNEGEFMADTKFETYYGSETIRTKFQNGTATSIFTVVGKSSQAMTFYMPRQTYRGGGNPVATGKNTDVMLALEGKASRDTTTSSHAIINRLEYYEA